MKNYPKAFCRLRKRVLPGGEVVLTWVVPCCPICGRAHSHGAGDDRYKIGETLGHRVAHCAGKKGLENAPTGYYLVRMEGSA